MSPTPAHPRTATPSAAAPPTPRRFHINGLDALRALAVLAVVVYHVRPALLPGGFIGVDMFFVVSGFLITTLLLRERAREGRISLRGFWVRRARRLLPALVAVIVVSVALSWLGSPDLRVGILRQIIGALTFSTNWVELAFGGSYFDHTSPVMFMNFWSLAVEEQFYLVWPLLFLLVTALVRGRRGRVAIALAAAAGSALLMALLHVPGQDATRVYYGTDTHSFGLLLGIALAFAWDAGQGAFARPGNSSAAAPGPRLAAFLLGLAVLVLCLTALTESAAATYRGGLLLASLGTLLVVFSQLGPAPALGRLMEARPLVWVGQRSYGIYLWHWPVLKILNSIWPADSSHPGWWFLQALAVAVTFLLAALSERCLERPVRRQGFRATTARVLTALGLRPAPAAAPRQHTRRLPAALAALLVLGLVGTAAAGVLTAPAQSQVAQELEASQQKMARTQQQAAERNKKANAAAAQHPGATDASGHPAFPAPRPEQVSFIGDSMVSVSIDGILAEFPGAMVDGVPNRKWDQAQQIVEHHLQDGSLSPYVVITFGTNGGIPDRAVLDRVLDTLGPRRAVVLVTLYGQSTFIEPDNKILQDEARKRPNVAVADWNKVAAAHPEYLQSDQTHPNIEGANVYARTLHQAFVDLSHRQQ